MPEREFDVAIVGAGIVGLGQAWAAARRGLSVVVFERDSAAKGASVRNFGMVWPIGQADGEALQLAMASRRLWLEFAKESGLWHRECGSIHLAHRDDEWDVLQEFSAQSRESGRECELLTPAQVLQKTPAAQPDQLQGGLWSPAELAVNPRQALAALPRWLHEEYGVEIMPRTLIRHVDAPRLESSDGRMWRAERVVVCGGADFQTLFPEVFAGSGLQVCKLQMMRTGSQPAGWRIGPHLASGLSLRHYAGFSECPALARLKQRIANETPELDRFGIHILVSQNNAGEAILGDSHDYDDVSPFDQEEINELILRELRRVVQLEDWTIAERWHGFYAKHPEKLYFEEDPQPGVKVLTAVGGAGMTLSFGLAESLWDRWDGAAALSNGNVRTSDGGAQR